MEQTSPLSIGPVAGKTRGVLWMLASSFAFSAMQFAVNLSSARIGTMQQMFCRNILCGLIAAALMKKRGVPFRVSPKSVSYLLGRSVFGFLSVFALFYASRNAVQVDVTIAYRTIPVWVTLIAALFMKERIPRVQLPVIALCLLGAGIAIRPSFSSNPFPVIVALLSAVFSGAAYTCISKVTGREDPLMVILFFSVFSTVVAGVSMLIHGYVAPTPYEWWLLVLIGLTGTLGQLGVTYAYKYTHAAEVSIYEYSGIVFSAVLGFFILREKLTLSSAVGAILIIGASLWSYLYNRKR